MTFSIKHIYLTVFIGVISLSIGCEFKTTTKPVEPITVEPEEENIQPVIDQEIKKTLFDGIKANVRKRNLGEAITSLNQFISRYPNDADGYNTRGVCYIYQGSINDSLGLHLAINDFNQAIELNSKNPRYYHNRGWAYQMQDDYSVSLRSFERARQLDSNYILFQHNVLRVKLLSKRRQEALELSDSLIQRFPKDGYAYHIRGNLKRDYLHQYPEGNKDKAKGKELGWKGGMNLLY